MRTTPRPLAMLLQLAADPRVARAEGEPVPLAALDGALLAWLAIEGPTPRARLAQLLWPDKPGETARNSLRQRLFQLRRKLGTELVQGGELLTLAAGLAHDLEDADGVLGHLAIEAIAPGEFAHWLEQQRARRRGRVRSALVDLAEMAEQAGDWPDALSHARELLAIEPLSEEAHRRVIRLHYLAGDRAAAMLAFDRCEQLLKDEVGVRPSPETMALLATIERAAQAAAAPAPARLPPSVLRPPRLVGRDREMRTLAQHWHPGSVLSVVGEAGMGKSRLLQEFADGRRGVVMAAGRPGDAGVPFATLARLLRELFSRRPADHAAPELPSATRAVVARVLPELDVSGNAPRGEGQRLALRTSLRELLATCGWLEGLIVDDLHFADEASLDMLHALVDDTQAAAWPLRWLLAHRPAEAGGAVQTMRDAWIEQARLVTVALEPLALPVMVEFIDALDLPGVAGDRLAPVLLRRTGGNPLFVLETLKQAWVEQALDHLADANRLPRPIAVHQLVARRVARLSPGALALARVASIAGVDFDLDLAEQVLGVPAMQFADALNELEAAQVLHDAHFVHDLVFEAVRASVPIAVARHTHARVAGFLAAHGAEPARVAGHFIDGGREADALPWLARAAQAAGAAARRKEQLSFLEAKARIETALCDGGDAAMRGAAFATQVDVAGLMVTLDDGAGRGATVCDELARLAATPSEQVRARLQRGHLALMRGELQAAEAAARDALRQAIRDDVAPAVVVECRIQLGTVLMQQDRPGEALPHFESSMAWIDEHADASARCEYHGNFATTCDRVGRVADAALHHEKAIALAQSLQHHGNELMCLANFAANRLYAGQPHEARALLERARLLRMRDPDASSLDGFIALNIAIADIQSGRFAEAMAALDTSTNALGAYAPGYVAAAAGHLANVWAHLGQWARVQQHLESLPEAGTLSGLDRCRHARLQAWLARGLGRARAPGVLEAALASIDPQAFPDMRHAVLIDLAEEQDTGQALATLRAVRDEADRLGQAGTVWLARAVLARRLAQQGRGDEARAELAAARAMSPQPVPSLSPLRHYLLRPWHELLRALVLLDETEQARALQDTLARWVRATAEQHVPAPFRDSFLHRNEINRDVLAAGAAIARR